MGIYNSFYSFITTYIKYLKIFKNFYINLVERDNKYRPEYSAKIFIV